MADAVSIELKSMPDGYGFLYGRAYRGENGFNINVMPPQAHWAGDFKLDGYEPHPTDWVLYVEGDEVARVQARGDVESEFVKVIAERRW